MTAFLPLCGNVLYSEFANIAQPLGSHHSGLFVGKVLAAFIPSNGQEGWAEAEIVLCCLVLPACGNEGTSTPGKWYPLEG